MVAKAFEESAESCRVRVRSLSPTTNKKKLINNFINNNNIITRDNNNILYSSHSLNNHNK